VKYFRLFGTRAEKFEKLSKLEILEAEFEDVEGDGLAAFVPRSAATSAFTRLTDLFPCW
jgi:hypothetical protein